LVGGDEDVSRFKDPSNNEDYKVALRLREEDRLEALRAAVAAMGLPAAYTTRVSGRGRELERTFGEFVWAFALSIVFMYMILASQFENLVHPCTILLSIPLCVPFALLSIWLTGNTADARELPSVDIFGGMNRGQVASNRRAWGTPWNHRKSLPGIATGEP